MSERMKVSVSNPLGTFLRSLVMFLAGIVLGEHWHPSGAVVFEVSVLGAVLAALHELLSCFLCARSHRGGLSGGRGRSRAGAEAAAGARPAPSFRTNILQRETTLSWITGTRADHPDQQFPSDDLVLSLIPTMPFRGCQSRQIGGRADTVVLLAPKVCAHGSQHH